jgi:hypothetical protein
VTVTRMTRRSGWATLQIRNEQPAGDRKEKAMAKVLRRQVLGGGLALLIGTSLDTPAQAQRRGMPHYD